MSREGDPQEWLNYAERDRRIAHLLFSNAEYEASAFHCQQAVEKLLKAVIVKQSGQRPPHTHELRALLDKINLIEIPIELADQVGNIGAYYIGTRYPFDVVDPLAFTAPVTDSALRSMEEIFRWFLTRISFSNG